MRSTCRQLYFIIGWGTISERWSEKSLLDLDRFSVQVPIQGTQSGLPIGAYYHSQSPAALLQHSLGTLRNGPNFSLENGGMHVEIADYFVRA